MVKSLAIYKFSDKEITKALAASIVQIDTREQQNKHILRYFDSKKIQHTSQKLDFADYSLLLPVMPELGLQREIYFNDVAVIERKANLNELAGNLTNGRQQFESELIRCFKSGAKMHLLIEGGSWSDIEAGHYLTKLSPKAYLGTLAAYQARFNIGIHFTKPDSSGALITLLLRYYLREHLKAMNPFNQEITTKLSGAG